MKVFIPVTGAAPLYEYSVSSMLSAEFGCVYNSKEKDFQIQEHSYDINSIGNLCVQLKAKGITTIITEAMPLLTYLMCLDMGLKVFKAKKSVSAQDNIKLKEMDLLHEFTAKDTVVDGDCMGACSRCSSTCSS